jgi:hypothetical protein
MTPAGPPDHGFNAVHGMMPFVTGQWSTSVVVDIRASNGQPSNPNWQWTFWGCDVHHVSG